MNKQILLAGLGAAVLLVAAYGTGVTQESQPQTPQSAPPVPYAMTMGDMMNTLVQPRHLKLGIAGHAGNWPLAAYALVEIRQTFAGIVKAQPKVSRLSGRRSGRCRLETAAGGGRRRHQAAGPEAIRRGLRSAHPRLQCLPRLARSSFRGDQGPRCVGVSESGFQSGTLGTAAASRWHFTQHRHQARRAKSRATAPSRRPAAGCAA